MAPMAVIRELANDKPAFFNAKHVIRFFSDAGNSLDGIKLPSTINSLL